MELSHTWKSLFSHTHTHADAFPAPLIGIFVAAELSACNWPF